MELRHIRYFLAVAEERNVTRAAARLAIGQPPLSQQIKDLEREIGAPLFRRLPHGMELTPAGVAFLDGVRGLPELTEVATRNARRAFRGEIGRIAIGFTGSTVFNSIVSATIRAYRRDHPDVGVRLLEANSSRLADALRDGDIDAAFLRPGAADETGLDVEVLTEEVMVVALPIDHPIAYSDPVDLSQLSDEPFLFTPREVGSTVVDVAIDMCRAAGFEPQISQYVPQMGSLLSLVSAGLGISIVPQSMDRLHPTNIAYRKAKGPRRSVSIGFARRRGLALPTAINLLHLARAF